MIRFYSKLIASFGGKVTRSYFRDLAAFRTDHVCGIELASESEEEITRMRQAVKLLEMRDVPAFKVVISWIERIGSTKLRTLKTNFCDGTVLIQSIYPMPVSVMAAFIYRLAVETMLARRFKFWEIVVNNPRCELLGLKRQLCLMKTLECPEGFISEQLEFIKIEQKAMNRRRWLFR